MTLIVALACSDGLVMAADSASTDSLSGTKQIVTKIQQIGDRPILFGGAGDAGLIQKIVERLDGLRIRPSTNFMSTRRRIRQACLPEMSEAVRTHVRHLMRGYETPPTAILLFGCVHDNKPHIIEIEADGRDTEYDQNLGCFQAIGSGKTFAQAMIRPHLTRERDLALGKIIAYRVIEDSIELSAGGLAKPIRLYTLTLDESFTELDSNELNNLGNLCKLWREIEGEALGRLVTPLQNQTPAIIPEP